MIPAASDKTARMSIAFGPLNAEFSGVKHQNLMLYAIEIRIQ